MDFESFYRDERESVLRLCFLVTLDVEAAADATQEAMLRAWQRWETLAPQQPSAWVRTVALNLCRSRWRRLQRELRLVPRLYHAPPAAEPRDPDLVAALRRLPPRQREAMVLFYWADMSVDGCASVMATSIGSVKQHLSRARRSLSTDRAIQPIEGIA